MEAKNRGQKFPVCDGPTAANDLYQKICTYIRLPGGGPTLSHSTTTAPEHNRLCAPLTEYCITGFPNSLKLPNKNTGLESKFGESATNLDSRLKS